MYLYFYKKSTHKIKSRYCKRPLNTFDLIIWLLNVLPRVILTINSRTKAEQNPGRFSLQIYSYIKTVLVISLDVLQEVDLAP